MHQMVILIVLLQINVVEFEVYLERFDLHFNEKYLSLNQSVV